ncbi:hypothetical protein H310_13857 [Aphanomyces invadans]|uniref:RNA polymerase II-associated protein 3 n=1 Tax=Aphanomyces invadans TaxID=157072 RepID=A0A024TE30_9STRA|nr:hypothetical protein H310_13857 [Aphanomyces invadans]ETV91607.1 hypothetical protein H310_13857 [Aphanomyces invadans]|eukprot:XP_008879726.1 hypothetical protein H310_13857 [Aphanomyces invadans]
MESLAVQRQIRENASYLQDYFSDLSSWEKSMAKKEEQLKKGPSRSAAPVRRPVALHVRGSEGSVSIQHPMNTRSEPINKPTKAPSQHVYDKGYKKWESFDVDAALKEIDADSVSRDDVPVEVPTRTSAPPKKVVTAPSKPPPPPVSLPRDVLEKEDGNNHFKQGEYAAAINCYSRSLSYNPRNPIVLSNRAMAHLKLQQYGKAEVDCSSALAVDPTHVKSLVRRATARNALGKHHAAIADLEAALGLESTNKAIATHLKTTRDVLKQSIKRSPTTKISVETIAPTVSAPTSSSVVVAAQATVDPAPPAKAKTVVPKIQVKLPDRAPSTAYEFVRVWNSLKHSSDKAALRQEYLLRLRPESLPKLFKDSIEADLVSDLIESLVATNVDVGVEFLLALTKVPRFAMVAMFLSPDEKAQVAAFAATHPKHDQVVAAFK